MDFLENLLGKHRDKLHGQQNGPSGYPAGPYRTDQRDHHETDERATDPYHREGRPGGVSLTGIPGAILRHKALWGVAAALLLVLAGGAVVVLVLLLPLVGKLLGVIGAQDLTGLLANLPKFLTTLLVEVPQAVIEYLGPLLKLKTALEGAG
jgi:hypothetical protein